MKTTQTTKEQTARQDQLAKIGSLLAISDKELKDRIKADTGSDPYKILRESKTDFLKAAAPKLLELAVAHEQLQEDIRSIFSPVTGKEEDILNDLKQLQKNQKVQKWLESKVVRLLYQDVNDIPGSLVAPDSNNIFGEQLTSLTFFLERLVGAVCRLKANFDLDKQSQYTKNLYRNLDKIRYKQHPFQYREETESTWDFSYSILELAKVTKTLLIREELNQEHQAFFAYLDKLQEALEVVTEKDRLSSYRRIYLDLVKVCFVSERQSAELIIYKDLKGSVSSLSNIIKHIRLSGYEKTFWTSTLKEFRSNIEEFWKEEQLRNPNLDDAILGRGGITLEQVSDHQILSWFETAFYTSSIRTDLIRLKNQPGYESKKERLRSAFQSVIDNFFE